MWNIITDDGKKKTSELWEECKSLFPCYSYYTNEELDKLCPAPKETITKTFSASIEPDRLNISYNDAVKEGIENFMSTRERIILELQYWKEIGKGLDITGWTITSTLDSDGFAMSMRRGANGRFGIGGDDRDCRVSDGGLRQLVSNPINSSLLSFSEAVKIVKEAGYKITKEKVIIEEL